MREALEGRRAVRVIGSKQANTHHEYTPGALFRQKAKLRQRVNAKRGVALQKWVWEDLNLGLHAYQAPANEPEFGSEVSPASVF